MTQPQTDLDKYLARWPIFGLVAPTGVGKTWLTGSLIDAPWSAPVRMIDADAGYTTIEALTEQPGKIDYRGYQGEADSVALVSWLTGEIRAAQKADCGAVVIEGMGSLYMLVRGQLMQSVLDANPGMSIDQLAKKLDGHHGQALSKAGAALMQTVITQIKLLSRAKLQAASKGARGGIVVATFTTRTSQVKVGNSMVQVEAAQVSQNVARNMMEACDGFFDMERDQYDNVTLLCNRTELNPMRKARNPEVAARISALRNPTFGTILDCYIAGKQATVAALNPAI
jgi:hypothetical protein